MDEQNRARIDSVADKLIDDKNKTINIERKNVRGNEHLIIKTTSTETKLNL